MALIDCGSGSTIVLTFYGAPLGAVITLNDAADAAKIQGSSNSFNGYEVVTAHCTGSVNSNFIAGAIEGTNAAVRVPLPVAAPYEQLLLGFLGLVCGLLIAWAFVRS